MVFDFLLSGGRVIAGDGSQPKVADLAIIGDRIVAIEPLTGRDAKTTIDVTGRIVCPGFIDAHGHSDSAVLINRRMESKVRQGVTTEIIGNCGSSLAPLAGPAVRTARSEIERFGAMLTWESFAGYLSEVESGRIATNVAALVGHGTLRESIAGQAPRPLDKSETTAMCNLLEAALSDGAIGFSSGLAYVPGLFADVTEIVALAKVVAHGGIYATHMRDEGTELIDAVTEALTVARLSGVALEISHLKASGQKSFGSTSVALEMIDAASRSGLSVGCDVYPYTATSTTLAETLPIWVRAGGGQAMLERLADPVVRRRLADEFDGPSWAGMLGDAGWDGVVVTGASGRPGAMGRSLAAIAADSGRHPMEEVCDLLSASSGSVGCVFFCLNESDVEGVIRHPLSVIGSDSVARAPYGKLGRGRPHPRGYGTFPRILGSYVRERRVLDLVEAVEKMSSRTAQRFGLSMRGRLVPGWKADVVVFDPDSVRDHATYAEPHLFPTGIEQVFVNGVPVVRDCEQTAELPGRVLRGGV